MLHNEEFFELKQMECLEERILEGMSKDLLEIWLHKFLV
jgi:hypothetical protein